MSENGMKQKRTAAIEILKQLKKWDGLYKQCETRDLKADDLIVRMMGESLDFVVYHLLDHPTPESSDQIKHFHDELALGDYYTEGFFMGVCSGYMSEKTFIEHADWCLEYMKKHNDEPITHFYDDAPDDPAFYRWFETGQHLIEGDYFNLDLSDD